MDDASCMDLEMAHQFFCTAEICLSNHMVHNTQPVEAEQCIGITLFIQGDLKNPVSFIIVCSTSGGLFTDIYPETSHYKDGLFVKILNHLR